EGEPVKAESLYREELAAHSRIHGGRYVDVAAARHRLGKALLRRGVPDSARVQFTREFEIVKSSLGESHPDCARALAGLAEAELRLGLVDTAITHALEAEDVSREHARAVLRGAPERVALNVAAARRGGLDLALSALGGTEIRDRSLAERAFDATVRSRALVLDEIAAR